MKNNITISLILLLCFGFAQSQAKFEAQEWSRDGSVFQYQILYPENFDMNKKYPVVLFLHGAGERGEDNQKQLVHGSKLFLDSEFRKQFPCVAIFPQCPRADYWSNADVERGPDGIKLVFKDGEPTPAMSHVMALMDSIVALNYSKDNQIYVGGLSMGGMGTFEILSRRPDMFAAALPICGGGKTDDADKYAKKVKLWVFHGAKDNVVLPSFSTEMVIAIREAGGDVKYTLYKDANHNSWDSAFAEEELFTWLFSTIK